MFLMCKFSQTFLYFISKMDGCGNTCLYDRSLTKNCQCNEGFFVIFVVLDFIQNDRDGPKIKDMLYSPCSYLELQSDGLCLLLQIIKTLVITLNQHSQIS
ncbi:hypothetical protein ACQJBY_054033 [Aegilops geniculata]